MQVIPPNFVSVRLDEQDKQNYAKVVEATEKAIGVRINTADLYRHAIAALAEKHNVKGVR
jgi:predicted ATP-grasp superfamily ATP-dependent carboligase